MERFSRFRAFAFVIACAFVALPSAFADSISSFTLINTDTDSPIAGYDPIPNGAAIDLARLPTRNLSIRANVSPSIVGSVDVQLDGATHLENSAPYGLCGDTSGDYKPCSSLLVLGSHTVKAIPYSAANYGGTVGSSLQIGITIQDSSLGGSSSSGRDAFSAIQAESYDSMSGISNAGSYVGYVDAGDYLLYKGVNFGAGAASVSVNVAVDASYAGKQIEFRLDSVSGTRIGALTVQSTGGWTNFQAQSATISGASGTHDLYLTFARGSGAQSDGIGNIDSFQFNAAPAPSPTPSPSPTSSVVFSVPGQIEAENFQSTNVSPSNGKGGQGAYKNLWSCSDSSGCGQTLGWIAAGETFSYPISVSAAGNYSIQVRHASPYSGKSFHVEVDGVNVTGSMSASYTGGWDAWASVSKTVSLSAGSHTLKFVADTDGYNINYVKIDTASVSYNGASLRVVEWNVSHGDAGVDAQVRQIAAAMPDVVMLAEVPAYYSGQADQYRQLLETYTRQTWYPVLAVHNYSGYGDASMLLSRFPFTASGTQSLGPSSWADMRNSAWGKINVNGYPVSLFSIHLDWPSDSYLLQNTSNMLNFEAQSQFSGRRITSGDYNAWVYGTSGQQQAIAQIRQQYTDSFIDQYGSDSSCPVTIQNGWRPDALYHNAGVRTNSVSVNQGSSLSDHYMVTIDLTLY